MEIFGFTPGSGQNGPSEKPSDSTAKVRLNRARIAIEDFANKQNHARMNTDAHPNCRL